MKNNRRDPDNQADLLVKYREGDSQAFRKLVDYYQGRMLQFFYRLCWDRDRAEDLTQELFLKLMQGCRRYRPQGKLSTFVYRVATNLWIDHYRSRRPQPRLYSLEQVVVSQGNDLAASEPTPLDVVAGAEERSAMRKALESLTEPHRIVFELAVYQERPYSEISQLLKVPVGTIKSRMHNSVKALKKLLSEAEESGDGQADFPGQSQASGGA